MTSRGLIGLLAWVFLGLAGAAGAQAQAEAKPVTIRGRIASVEGRTLRVATGTGTVSIRLSDKLRISAVIEARLSDLTEGKFIGTAARREPDGTLRALEVHIFPEERRGTGEGHRPYDIPGTTMTNANIEKFEEISIGNVKGRLLTLKYKGSEVKVFVPPDAPVVRIAEGSRDMIKPGAGVVVRSVQSPDGTITAVRLSVGVAGIMPPM